MPPACGAPGRSPGLFIPLLELLGQARKVEKDSVGSSSLLEEPGGEPAAGDQCEPHAPSVKPLDQGALASEVPEQRPAHGLAGLLHLPEDHFVLPFGDHIDIVPPSVPPAADPLEVDRDALGRRAAEED